MVGARQAMFVGWFAAALAGLPLPVTRGQAIGLAAADGAFLLVGALLTISLMPI